MLRKEMQRKRNKDGLMESSKLISNSDDGDGTNRNADINQFVQDNK